MNKRSMGHNYERGRALCCRWQPEIRENVGNQWSVTKNMLQMSGVPAYLYLDLAPRTLPGRVRMREIVLIG